MHPSPGSQVSAMSLQTTPTRSLHLESSPSSASLPPRFIPDCTQCWWSLQKHRVQSSFPALLQMTLSLNVPNLSHLSLFLCKLISVKVVHFPSFSWILQMSSGKLNSQMVLIFVSCSYFLPCPGACSFFLTCCSFWHNIFSWNVIVWVPIIDYHNPRECPFVTAICKAWAKGQTELGV